MAAGDVNASTEPLRWDLLEAEPPGGERLTVRAALPKRRADVLIGVDAARRRYVLIEVPESEPTQVVERTSRGIAVRTVEMNVGGGRLLTYVEISCLESQGHSALDIVVCELVDALDAGASIGRVPLVQNVLAKWRRFWSGVNQGLLSRDQQVGLFGELWFLCRWLGSSIGIARAVQTWRGPLGARNDFELPHLGIEVKCTSRGDAIHHINGLEQLLEPEDGSLFLFSLVVREEASAADCTPMLIQELRQALGTEYDALSWLDACLYACGYQDALAAEYEKLKVRVRTQELYRVSAGFPRLVPASLVGGGPPAGVGNVEYELGLDSASAWLLASAPGAAAKLLQDFAR